MELTQARVRELFDYLDHGCLVWRVTKSNRSVSGSIAGSLRKDRYRTIRIDGRTYYAHRLVYLWHHGEMPDVIDHADGNQVNNRIENLRKADMRLNQGNKRKKSRGDLPKGVDWRPRMNKWQSRITVNSKVVHLGTFDSAEAAHAAYVEAAQKHFGEFARAA
jgi:hypothetical protein